MEVELAAINGRPHTTKTGWFRKQGATEAPALFPPSPFPLVPAPRNPNPSKEAHWSSPHGLTSGHKVGHQRADLGSIRGTPRRGKAHACPSGLQASELGLIWPCQGGSGWAWSSLEAGGTEASLLTCALTPCRPCVGSLETPSPDL